MSETRIVAMGDSHGSHADKDTLNAIMRFVREFKPQERVHLGDAFDAAYIRNGASKDEKESSYSDFKRDIKAGIEWIKRYEPTVFLMGNHEYRIQHNIDVLADSERRDCLIQANSDIRNALRSVGCRIVKDYKVRDNYHRIGPITFIHGNGSNPMGAAYRVNGGPGSAVVMGHYHRAEQLNMERLDGGTVWLCGCACDLDMTYAEARYSTFRWQHSFMGFKVHGGHYIGRQAHRFRGKWIMPFQA